MKEMRGTSIKWIFVMPCGYGERPNRAAYQRNYLRNMMFFAVDGGMGPWVYHLVTSN